MAADTAFLKEVRAFLDTSALSCTQAIRNEDKGAETASTELWAADSILGNKGRETAKEARHKTRKEKEALRKQRYHHRQKNERETLRRAVGELELLLRELKRRKHERMSGIATEIVESMWRDSAARQRELRLRSEGQQKLLLEAVAVQSFYIENLRPLKPAIGASDTTRAREWTDAFLFEEYLREVEGNYTLSEQVYSECSFDDLLEGIYTSSHRCNSSGEVMYSQHLNKVLQPFSYEQTSTNMWKLAKLPHRQHDRVDIELGDPNNTVAIRFRLVHTLGTRSTVSVLQRYVFRRYIGHNRTAFVWKTHSEGEGAFRGIRFVESGWVSIRPTQDATSTLLEICVRQAPVEPRVSGLQNQVYGDFRQVLQRSVEDDAREIITELDNLLLEDTLAGIVV